MFPLLGQVSVLAGNLSGGEQQILETAMVLEAAPQIPPARRAVARPLPANQDQIFETIADLRRHGLTVLVVEQNAHGALQISDTGIVMELGRLFMTGPAAEIIGPAHPRRLPGRRAGRLTGSIHPRGNASTQLCAARDRSVR